MKQYLLLTNNGHGRPETFTEEHIILACDRGEIDRSARVAFCRDAAGTEAFEPICSVPQFRKVIEIREADVERRRQVLAERVKASVTTAMAKLIARHIGRTVQINGCAPDSLDEARLSEVNDAYVTFQNGKKALLHVPLPHILHIAEDGAAVTIRIAHPQR